MIDDKGQLTGMNQSEGCGEDPELKTVLGTWGSPQTPASLSTRLRAAYRHEMNRNAIPVKHFFYWALGLLMIGTSAVVLWLALGNSGPAPTLSSTPTAAPKMPVAGSTEPVTPASPQRVIPIGPPAPVSPKTVTVRFIKKEGSPIRLDRLDGYSITLESASTKYVSTPVLTDDEAVRGNCRLVGVLPGNYTLNIPRFGISHKITIPAQDEPVTIELTFRTGELRLRVFSDTK